MFSFKHLKSCKLNFGAILMVVWGISLLSFQTIAAPNVVVSIQPIHSLVAGVMQGMGAPALLINGAQSPHTYMLRPSQAQHLSSADLVIWVGSELERSLEKPIAARSKQAKQLRLIGLKGLKLYPFRRLSDYQPHDHSHKIDSFDPHIWMDIDNAKVIVIAIADELRALDPQNAASYTANQQALLQRLDRLHHILKASFAPFQHKAFMVFHDGYQYLEKAYGLHDVGAITLDPELQISAKRLSMIQAQIKQQHVCCLFAEAQFQTTLIDRLAQKMKIKIGILDPYGAALQDNPEDKYFTLMQNLASQFAAAIT